MVFDGYDKAGPLRELHYGAGVERLEGGDMQHRSRGTGGGEEVDGLDRPQRAQARADETPGRYRGR